MIAACPKCGARYRIERHRIRPDGVRLRCSRCEAVFRVRPPAAAASAPAAAPSVGAAEPRAAASTATSRAPAPAPAPPSRDRSRLVVVADPDPERAKRTAAALSRAGLETVLAHDGVEAILAIQRVMPRAVVLDAALPKMFGFQVCELMKRNESLRSIRVLLVGSHHHPERYRRPPSELYGADAYLEDATLPDAALETLRRLGLPVPSEREAPGPRPASESAAPAAPPPVARRGAPAPAPARAPGVAPAKSPGVAPRAPVAAARPAPAPRETPPSPDPALADAVAKAERLARIIVSDIILYNEDRFAEAVRAGNVLAAFAPDLQEGQVLLRERVEARVREHRDFLRDELLRVARARGMK
jgi:predicted Zn finger-like uncharacterized protein